MERFEQSYSVSTQAEFYKAEAEILLFNNRLVNDPCARYMKGTMLAIDAVFATRMSHGFVLPVVPLITAYDLTDWRYQGDTTKSVRARRPEFQFPEEQLEAATLALHYMQAMDWVSEIATPETDVTLGTVLRLHDILVSGKQGDGRYHGFRSEVLPDAKGTDPALIPVEVNELCQFVNSNLHSPLGQASVIHHTFESITPFDSMVDRTGLVLALMSMFKRGLFSQGYLFPICWGASTGLDYREQLRDSSRDKSSLETHDYYRECWAVYNARNTHMSVVIADSFLNAANKLRAKWRSQLVSIPANSALDRLLDLFLALPGLSTIRASEVIGKSYGATNEAMRQLAKAGIVREVALDGRERIFICEQSAAMITEFVDNLVKVSERAEAGESRSEGLL